MMKRGEYVGSPDCYGYDWNKETKSLDINEEQAEVVRMIFNWYVNDGLGCRRIANKLEEMKIPSYTGARWSTSSVSNMIHQEFVRIIKGKKCSVINDYSMWFNIG